MQLLFDLSCPTIKTIVVHVMEQKLIYRAAASQASMTLKRITTASMIELVGYCACVHELDQTLDSALHESAASSIEAEPKIKL